jgi:hypothetical protein
MDVLGLILLMLIPALGFVILWRTLDRWGRKSDPMKPSHLDHLSPGAPGRDRSSFED